MFNDTKFKTNIYNHHLMNDNYKSKNKMAIVLNSDIQGCIVINDIISFDQGQMNKIKLVTLRDKASIEIVDMRKPI
jgi:hypothetical protein